MKCLITDKELKGLEHLQESLEEGQITKEHAAMSLKYILEDIEALELTVLDEFSRDGARVMTATYKD